MSETVSDTTGRAALDLVVSGHVEMQKEFGVAVPSASKATEWARGIVERQIKEHETRPTAKSLGHLDEKDPGEPKSRIDRGDVGPDASVINRPVGTGHFNTGIFESSGDIRIERRHEDRALRARLDLLMTLPEWKGKIERAALEGEALFKLRMSRGAASSMKEYWSLVADHVIEVAEKSIPLLGEYRGPWPHASKSIVG